jgi:NAD(P)-dependent dehydrogenase (short-subunit alcohol dehydrogenase family)
MRLKDKVTAITGAGRKICRAAAELFARVARFPASDEASFLNGAILVADCRITINGDLSRMPGEGGVT